MKRLFLTVAFIIGIILCNSSCSQENEMDQGKSGGGGVNSALKANTEDSSTNCKNDSIIQTNLELE